MSDIPLSSVFTQTRLQICAYLSACDEADFSAVQEYCGLSKSTLSKSLTMLDEQGFVTLGKSRRGRYTKTTLCLTDTGREALATHLDSLREIADAARRAGGGN